MCKISEAFLWVDGMKKLLMMMALMMGSLSAHAQSASNASSDAPIRYVILNKDFTKYSTPMLKSPNTENQIELIYFFWYGSPWSYEIDRQLRQWAATQSYPVKLSPAPVIFDGPYQIFGARIFFALQHLGEEKRLGPLFFEAVTKRQVDFSSLPSITSWMDAHGIPKEKFLTAINHPKVRSSTAGVELVMEKYQAQSVPTVVIDGQYVVRAHEKQSPKRMLEVVKFMTQKLSEGGPRP